MKIKFSSLVDDASGKDGALVIHRSRTGPVAAPRKTGRNPRTEAQTLVRANLGSAATEFVNLAPEEIDAWNAYGASRSKSNPVNGKRYGQTGINAYVELTTVFKLASPGAASVDELMGSTATKVRQVCRLSRRGRPLAKRPLD